MEKEEEEEEEEEENKLLVFLSRMRVSFTVPAPRVQGTHALVNADVEQSFEGNLVIRFMLKDQCAGIMKSFMEQAVVLAGLWRYRLDLPGCVYC
ncbi:hypothetical protein DNTS_016498 [Danionella cerebrum]|uniref:Uncharacterized protein n=1 Tax=Danionella cerebrum TaxID=2873325 RepID=A0A553RIT0_9TELE|nr:hypothetical protein DNTS_016498 [Danionella translucida]